jgi:hypothetical protein
MKHVPILILFLIGCCEFDYETEFYVDPRMEPYVTAFYREAECRGITLHRNLIVRIENTPGVVGTTKFIGDQRIVIIDQEDLLNASEFYAKQLDTLHCIVENLVYHELGHALLNRKHCDPCYSIMAQKMSLMEYAGDPDKRSILINEMFLNPDYEKRH